MAVNYNAEDYDKLERDWIELVRPDEDMAILNELLERKQAGIPKPLRLAHSIEDIEKMSPTFPYAVGTKLNEGATFADQLRFRGAVIDYIKTGTPLEKWEKRVLLSYFVSNVDKDRNFNLFFQQTRARAFDYLTRWTSRKASALEAAYVLACLETVGFGPVPTIRGSPTYWRNRFVERLQEDPSKYRFIGQDHVRRLNRRSMAHMDKAALAWNAKVDAGELPPSSEGENPDMLMMWIYTLCGGHLTLDRSTMLFSGMRTGVVQILETGAASDVPCTEKNKKKRHHKSRSQKKGNPSGVQKNMYPDKTISKHLPRQPIPEPKNNKTLLLNISAITHETKSSEVLAGLVAKFPGWCPTQSFLLSEQGMDIDSEEWGLPVTLPAVYNDGSEDDEMEGTDEEGISMFGLCNELGQLDLSGSKVDMDDVIREMEKAKLDDDNDADRMDSDREDGVN
ncbi:uncharacterized protein EI97DRAFT_446337 [Westerdykella ornata]|uniref:Uncharacterized protein n=1 Tax=Westerdykella ornata TaxID=318751 RepID=A0A6A6J581_WESOR|nr:uncharacterized protein EI97DRAFT_446337 [Westerdykella ornata]KAF2271750.1 hypothetical protein EI97DRAFT_446337 [Westerdykella ornata]